jgi:hypothetical protein
MLKKYLKKIYINSKKYGKIKKINFNAATMRGL